MVLWTRPFGLRLWYLLSNFSLGLLFTIIFSDLGRQVMLVLSLLSSLCLPVAIWHLPSGRDLLVSVVCSWFYGPRQQVTVVCSLLPTSGHLVSIVWTSLCCLVSIVLPRSCGLCRLVVGVWSRLSDLWCLEYVIWSRSYGLVRQLSSFGLDGRICRLMSIVWTLFSRIYHLVV